MYFLLFKVELLQIEHTLHWIYVTLDLHYIGFESHWMIHIDGTLVIAMRININFPIVDGVMLLLLAAVRVTSRSSCPDDVETSTSQCLREYNSLASSLQMGGQTFFSGHDVETIRSLCQRLKSGFRCASRVKGACPAQRHVIEGVVSDYTSVLELCVYDNLYEVYARHQSCFQRINRDTRLCYEEYRTSTDHLMESVHTGNVQAQKVMCSHYQTLVECVEADARSQCDSEAAELADYLIKPSVAGSDTCQAMLSTTAQPPADEYYESVAEQEQKDSSQPNSAQPSHTSLSMLLTVLTSLIILDCIS